MRHTHKTHTASHISRAELISQIKSKRLVFAVWAILRILILAVAVRSAMQGLWESFFVCLLALMLFLAPPLVEKKLHLKLPTALEVTVLIFIFCAEILGEIECYYIKYAFWDSMLHTVNGFLFAAFGFCLVDLLNENPNIKFQLSPTFQALTAFCFSMTIGIFWEFFEYGMDNLLMLDMQKDTIIYAFQSVTLDAASQNIPVALQDITQTTITCADGTTQVINGYLDIGLRDTMKDLFVNFIGAAAFSTIGWAYVKQRGKNRLAAAFIPVVEKSDREEQR